MKFNTTYLKGDLFGGLTAGVVALPLALAFGVQSGLGAIAGLYGAIALGFFASLLGGTSTQISGPTGPMTVISSLVIATVLQATGGLENGLGIILGIFLLAGVIQIIFGAIGLGSYIKYIPYPVLSGFMTGIGVIIILLQVYPLFGLNSPTEIIDIVKALHVPLQQANWSTFGLGGLTILIIYSFPYLTKAIPSTIVALIVVSAMTMLIGLDVPVIGNIPEGFPQLKIAAFQQFSFFNVSFIIESAVTLAALGVIDSLLTSVVADNITKTKHQSNKELVGQGVGNIAAALIGGIPGAGATMRTVVNARSGGRTRLSGIIHSLFLLVVLLGLGKYAAYIPLCVLAGILITVGISIIDYKAFKHFMLIPKTDAFIMLVVLYLTVFVNLLQAVAVGMILASILFMKKMADLAEEKTVVTPLETLKLDELEENNEMLPNELKEHVYIKHLYGPLFFGFCSQFQELLTTIPTVRYVVLRMEDVPYIDQSGLYALEEGILYLESRNIDVVVCGIQKQPKAMLERVDIIPDLIEKEHLFENFYSCYQWLQQQFTGKS